MQKLKQIQGQAIPLDMNDVDTDLIIPAQYLTSVSTSGYGEHLFRRLKDADKNFVFNQPQFNNPIILIAKDNFGCGSSREHAVWALQQAGIRAVVAMSFADIFYNNSAKNGLVLIKQSSSIIDKLLSKAQSGELILTVDLSKEVISTASGENYPFDFDRFIQYCLLNGLEELEYLISHKQAISDFRETQTKQYFLP